MCLVRPTFKVLKRGSPPGSHSLFPVESRKRGMRFAAWLPVAVLLPLAGCLAPGGDGSPATSEGQRQTVPPSAGDPMPGSPGTATPSPPSGKPSGPAADGTAGSGTAGNGSGEAAEGGVPPPAWAAVADATIRPGVQVLAGGSQCTSNFLFTSATNASVYIGFAAHCVTHGDPNAAADGCDPVSEPMAVGTPLEVAGADHPARLAYTSWGAMQANGEQGPDECRFNDFALAELDPRDVAAANPAMLFFGGPTRLAHPGNVTMFAKVMSYGDSGLRAGVAALSPHEGYVIGPPGDGGWTTAVYTVPQGVPGDSGSGVLLKDGSALGVLVTISFVGGSNGVTTLYNALGYASAEGMPVALATSGLLESGTLPPLL